MGLQSTRRVAYLLSGCLAAALAACQGNLGSGGSGLSIPQAPGYGQPGGPAGGPAGSQSRQQLLEGAVYVTQATKEIPLPQVEGFGVTLALGTAPPAVPEAATGAPAGASASAPARRASIKAAPGASSEPASDPSAAPSVAPSAQPSGGPKPSPSPAPAKIETKTTIYPDDAPDAPTPEPTGEVQTFVKRTALVRGYLMPAQDVTLYGLGAVRFKIPSTEQLPGRGYTVAIFQSGKRHHDKLLDSDTDSKLANDVIASDRSDASIVLKKGTGYLLLLYGDEAPATPAPVQSGYPTPGNNPFPMPSAYGTPYPGQATYPPGQPNPYATYAPGQPNPYATPTPFR